MKINLTSILSPAILKTLGFEARKMIGKIAPLGRGSGEQYVREQFAKFITAHRQVKHENVILVVITDADKKDEHAYENRLNTLMNTLTEPLSKEEKIVILIPAKNIETWFRYADNPVECDEKTDYKSNYKGASPSAYGKKYAEDICPNLPPDAPSALQKARMEVERVKGLLS